MIDFRRIRNLQDVRDVQIISAYRAAKKRCSNCEVLRAPFVIWQVHTVLHVARLARGRTQAIVVLDGYALSISPCVASNRPNRVYECAALLKTRESVLTPISRLPLVTFNS